LSLGGLETANVIILYYTKEQNILKVTIYKQMVRFSKWMGIL